MVARTLFIAAWVLVLVSLVLTDASGTASGIAGVAAGVLMLAAAATGLADLADVESKRQRGLLTSIVVVAGVLAILWGAANLG